MLGWVDRAAPGVLRPAIIYLHGGGWMSGHKEEVQQREFDYA